MNAPIEVPERWSLPNHLQLPYEDGKPVRNYQEPPQAELLTGTLEPILRQVHPDGNYICGRDLGIYWTPTDPPMLGCKAPDWFYVANVPPLLDGQLRRSYVLWYEVIAPLIAIEFISGDGSEERDTTPQRGKFWVYERGIHVFYYALFDFLANQLEVYALSASGYQQMTPNERGHFPVAPLPVELGLWQGRYENIEGNWIRWWDEHGNLLPTPAEHIALLNQRSERMAARLRELGIDPESV